MLIRFFAFRQIKIVLIGRSIIRPSILTLRYTELQSLSSLPIAKRDDVAMVLSEATFDAAYALRGSATTSMRLGRVISRERQAEQQEMK